MFCTVNLEQDICVEAVVYICTILFMAERSTKTGSGFGGEVGISFN